MMLGRRAFITGLGASLVAAPAVVRAASLYHVDQRTVDLLLRPNSLSLVDTYSLAGRTQVDPSTITNAINIVFIGQSTNSNSISGGTYSPTHGSNVFNLSIAHRGAVFIAASPLLESDLTLDHHGRWLADSLITDGKASNVILTMASFGGTASADWAPGGGNLGASPRLGEIAYRIGLAARCIANAGLSSVRTIIDWQQGEADTDSATSQADYTSNLNKVVAECKKVGLLVTGNVMFVNKCTRITGLTASRNAVRAAQAAVPDGGLVRVGADPDTLDSSYRYDGTHFNFATGAAAQAGLKKTVYETWL